MNRLYCPTPLQHERATVYDRHFTDLETEEVEDYGTVATLSASSAAVPEPTTSALALAALCLAMSRRRAF